MHSASRSVPGLFSLFLRIDKDLITEEEGELTIAIIIVTPMGISMLVAINEISLLNFKARSSGRRPFNLLLSMESGQHQHAQEINGLNRRRAIFLLLDFEVHFFSVSIPSNFPCLCLLVTMLICCSIGLGFHMVRTNFHFARYNCFLSLLNVFEYFNKVS